MNTEVMQPPQLSIGRLLLLVASSVILCLSFIMSVFAPFPLALAITMYGRVKGYLVGIAGLILSFVLAGSIYGDYTLFGFYFCVLVFGIGIAEIVLRNISPIKGMVLFGIGFIITIATSFILMMNSMKTTPQQFILQQIEKSADKIAEQKKAVEMSGDKDAIQVLQLLDRPDLLAKEMMESFPSYFFMGVFIMLWFNMFLVLKSRRLLFSGTDYSFDEKCLLNFKVPFEFVLVLALGLILALFAEKLGSLQFETLGFTTGFFRTLLVMITIFMASYLIAVAGLFDNWFDFRKYFVKRNIED